MWCHQQLHCIFLSRSLNFKQAPCLAVQSSTPSKTGTLLYHVNLRGIKILFEAGFLTWECCLHEPFAYLGSSTRTWLPYQVFLHSKSQFSGSKCSGPTNIWHHTWHSQLSGSNSLHGVRCRFTPCIDHEQLVQNSHCLSESRC